MRLDEARRVVSSTTTAEAADPVRQRRLPEALLRSDSDGAVWRALAARLEKTTDVEATP